MKTPKTIAPRVLLLSLLFIASQAFAQSQPASDLPEWDKLSPQQRDALIAPVRERWNNEPRERPRMLERAQRWKTMDPKQREQARKGMRRFEGMSPQQREEARALYQRMSQLPPEQRKQLREQWRSMTREQRREWVDKNAPKKPASPPLK